MARTDFKPLSYRENDIDERTIRAMLGDKLLDIRYDSGQPVLEVKREHVLDVARILKDAPELEYNAFTDVTAADLMTRDDFEPERRFQLIVILYSVKHRRRVRIRAFLPESDPTAPSLTPIFGGADLTEREVFDMFGIRFTGHPNLKRLLTPEYMKHHVLRKDYPTIGRGERDNFPRYEEIK